MSTEDSKSGKFKELQVDQEPYMLWVDDTVAILEGRYGTKFLAVENYAFKIQEWQAAKKFEDVVCFIIKPENFSSSQYQGKK